MSRPKEIKPDFPEEWRDIRGYEGKYQISNYGRCMSLNYHRQHVPKILVPKRDKSGYLHYSLCDGNGGVKHIKAHRLVLDAFVPNPDPEVFNQCNHKDENKTNNIYTNLEWSTPLLNTNYGTRNKRARAGLCKPVYNISTDTVYPSATDAAIKIGKAKRSSIADACLGRQKTSCGDFWMFLDVMDDEPISKTPEEFVVERIQEWIIDCLSR